MDKTIIVVCFDISAWRKLIISFHLIFFYFSSFLSIVICAFVFIRIISVSCIPVSVYDQMSRSLHSHSTLHWISNMSLHNIIILNHINKDQTLHHSHKPISSSFAYMVNSCNWYSIVHFSAFYRSVTHQAYCSRISLITDPNPNSLFYLFFDAFFNVS